MKVFLIISITILIIFITYKIWLKNYRKREAKNIYRILLQDYLGKDFFELLQTIKNAKFETIFQEGIRVENDYRYIFTHSHNYKTLKVYQFKDNICIGFYIQSYEEKYSLPYWNFSKEYVKTTEDYTNRISLKDDFVGLALYTIHQFKFLFAEVEDSFEIDDDFFFQSYYKVNKNRFLSINIDSPSFARSNYPLYLYLCSNNIIEMKKFRNYIFEYFDFFMQFIINQDKLNKSLNEQ